MGGDYDEATNVLKSNQQLINHVNDEKSNTFKTSPSRPQAR